MKAYLVLVSLLSMSLIPKLVAAPLPSVNDEPKEKILIVGMGGWGSCENGGLKKQYIAEPFFNLVDNLRDAGLNVDYLLTCSIGKKQTYGHDPIRYLSKRTPFHGNNHKIIAEKDIFKKINEVKLDDNTKVYIIGHSHGGWTAMHTTEKLGFVDGLFTLEPISIPQCGNFKVVKDRVVAAIREAKHKRKKLLPVMQRRANQKYNQNEHYRHSLQDPCKRAPNDLNNEAIALAAGDQWYNFHLRHFEYNLNGQKMKIIYDELYSSPIFTNNNLVQNVEFRVTTENKKKSHHMIGLDPQSWKFICQKLSTKNGLVDSNHCKSMEVGADGAFIKWL